MSGVVMMNRRMFLRGVSGATLALPLLPSLFTSNRALAQAVAQNKCFVHMRTPHGGVLAADMWPADSALTSSATYLHTVRRGALSAPVSNGNAVISPALSAPSSQLTPALLAKMNVLRGLDISTNMAHNFGGALGYYDLNKQTPDQPTATIDQIMAYSSSVYPDLSTVRARSVAISLSNSGSYGYKTPGVASSGVSSSPMAGIVSSQALYDLLLGNFQSSGGGTVKRPAVVDQILDSYRRLRNGNKRLSSADKQRLDQHIEAVDELQRRLGTTVSAGCQVPTRPSSDNSSLQSSLPGNPSADVQYFQMINQVLAVALNCGATRVVTLQIDENSQNLTFTNRAPQGEDWHNNVAHSASSAASAAALVNSFNQTFFSGVYLDLAQRLNSFSNGNGGTVLDDSLVCWGQECGNVTHFAFSMPVITAGSAGGFLKTGSYCDYRNTSQKLSGDSTTGGEQLWSGLLYNQWLTTALQAMGVPSSQWAAGSHPGYGSRPTWQSSAAYIFTNEGTTDTKVYSDAMWAKTAEILPFLS